jgi:hypothetical protein
MSEYLPLAICFGFVVAILFPKAAYKVLCFPWACFRFAWSIAEAIEGGHPYCTACGEFTPSRMYDKDGRTCLICAEQRDSLYADVGWKDE